MVILLIMLMFLTSLVLSRLFRWETHGALCCGLVGFSGWDEVNTLKLRILLKDATERGKDSTGIYGTQLYKDNVNAHEFITAPAFKLAATGATNIIAHTRHATMGGLTKENAHPYRYKMKGGDLYGTHNGWLISDLYDEMLANVGIDKKPSVDSMAIYEHLVNNKLDLNALADLEGAIALAYLRNNKLHLYRRCSKPLFIGNADEGIYYSSRIEGLEQIDVEGIHELQQDRLYVFDKGIITETQVIRRPTIVLGLDSSPKAWNMGFSVKDKDIVGKKFPKWREALAEEEAKKYVATTNTGSTGKARTGTGTAGAGQSGQLGFTAGNWQATEKPDSPFLDQNTYFNFQYELKPLFRHVEKVLIANSKRISIPRVDAHVYEHSDQSTCFIMLSLGSSIGGGSLPYWLVKAKGHDVYAITDIDGNATLQLTNKAIENKIELLFIDPFDEQEYYTNVIEEVTAGKVLEVTFNVPFRTGQKIAPEDRLQFDRSVFLRRCYREAVQSGKVKNTPEPVQGEVHVGQPKSDKGSSNLQKLYEKYSQEEGVKGATSFVINVHNDTVGAFFPAWGHLMVPLKFIGKDILFPDIKVTDWGLPLDYDSLREDQWNYFMLKKKIWEARLLKKEAGGTGLDATEYFKKYVYEANDEEFCPEFVWKMISQIKMERLSIEALKRSYEVVQEDLEEVSIALDNVDETIQLGKTAEDFKTALEDMRVYLSERVRSKSYMLEHIKNSVPELEVQHGNKVMVD